MKKVQDRPGKSRWAGKILMDHLELVAVMSWVLCPCSLGPQGRGTNRDSMGTRLRWWLLKFGVPLSSCFYPRLVPMVTLALLRSINWEHTSYLNSSRERGKPEPFWLNRNAAQVLTMFFNKVNSFGRAGGKSGALREEKGLKSLGWCELSCEEQVPTSPHLSRSFFRLHFPSQFTIKHIILCALIFLPHSAASLCSKAAKK